ncbi:MAG TPA: hypothetical protein PKM40_05110 [Bacteroidia bacterium]|nr:hypothetical protein [Bacteroidia bacterium]
MSKFNLMSAIGPLMKDLVMGTPISEILNKVFTPEMQSGIALKLHDIIEAKLKEHDAQFAVFAVVPVPVTNNGKPVLDHEGKQCHHLRIKLLEIVNENDKATYGRVLMNLSINELINELKKNIENN